MREQKTKAQEKNTTIRSYSPPVPLPTPWCKSNTPYLIHSPIISYTYIMGIELLVQMRQSNKCGNVKNDEILTLGIWCGPLSQHPLPPARPQPHLLIPSAQTIGQKSKEPRNANELPANHIILPWPMYAESRAKQGRLETQP